MDNKIIIDCSLFTSKENLHTIMKEKIISENYLGNNLDAFHDALASINKPLFLYFFNVTTANVQLGAYFDRFIKVLLDSSNENKNINVTFSY